MLKGIFSAIIGLFMEPIRGAKKSGFKGALLGFGKGLAGLVLKPVAGTLDLVTLTARGIANTPKTLYLNISRVLKRKKKEPRSVDSVVPFLGKKSIEES